MTDDERVRAECDRLGLRFRPWEIHPADVDDGPSPHPPGTAGAASWPHAQRRRRQLLAEIATRRVPGGGIRPPAAAEEKPKEDS